MILIFLFFLGENFLKRKLFPEPLSKNFERGIFLKFCALIVCFAKSVRVILSGEPPRFRFWRCFAVRFRFAPLRMTRRLAVEPVGREAGSIKSEEVRSIFARKSTKIIHYSFLHSLIPPFLASIYYNLNRRAKYGIIITAKEKGGKTKKALKRRNNNEKKL